MAKEFNQNAFGKQSSFRLSLDINFKQIIVILLILAILFSIPLAVGYIQSPDKTSLNEILNSTVETFRLKTEETDSPFMLTIPVVNTDVDLTIVKQNPQLITYAGLFFVTISILIGIALIKNLRK